MEALITAYNESDEVTLRDLKRSGFKEQEIDTLLQSFPETGLVLQEIQNPNGGRKKVVLSQQAVVKTDKTAKTP